jgi:hypothetical protein
VSTGATYVRIVQGAAALANGLKAAGIEGRICVAVLREDGERLHDAIGRGAQARCKIIEEDGLRKCEFAGLEFRWPI